jgi:hypothetical protein
LAIIKIRFKGESGVNFYFDKASAYPFWSALIKGGDEIQMNKANVFAGKSAQKALELFS